MAIEYYNEGLVPKGMCELINQVVPRSKNRFKVIFKNRVEERGLSGRIWYTKPDRASWIEIYPTVIQLRDKSYEIQVHGIKSFNSWCSLLFVLLHEFGHYFDNIPHSGEQYANDYELHAYIESLADRWAIKTMSQIRDDRLGQPEGRLTGYLGVIEYRYEKRADDIRKNGYSFGNLNNWNNFTYSYMENTRARIVGGQYSVSHVAEILKVSRYTIKKAATILGISRCYIDRSGRRHLFFNHGEMSRIAYCLRDTGKKRYTEEEIRERAIRESNRKQKKWMMNQPMTGDYWIKPSPEVIAMPTITEDLEIPF